MLHGNHVGIKGTCIAELPFRCHTQEIGLGTCRGRYGDLYAGLDVLQGLDVIAPRHQVNRCVVEGHDDFPSNPPRPADQEWLELVEDDVRELVAGTFLEEAQVFRVSALTGEGLPELKQALLEMVAETKERKREGPFRLPVDRSFLVKGFGLVCTGTVLSGQLGGRDTVVVQPAGTRLRVRSLQRHGQQVEEVGAGDRAAVNLPGVEQGEVDRGDLLAEPGFFEPTYMLDARLQLLASCPRVMVQRTRVRLHLGTREVMARVELLDRDVLTPGKSGLVQLRLESPAVAVWGDRFVIRRYSPALTIGGGTVLEPHPVKHRRSETGISERLEALEGEDTVRAMAAKLLLARDDAVDMRALAGDLGLNLQGAGAAAGRAPRVRSRLK